VVHLFINREGILFVDQTAAPEEAFRAILKEKLEEGPKKTVFLLADREAPFHRFVHVLDVTRGLGLRDLAIVTDPSESQAGAPPRDRKEERP
jgi:biopolymer transport protein ExbD